MRLFFYFWVFAIVSTSCCSGKEIGTKDGRQLGGFSLIKDPKTFEEEEDNAAVPVPTFTAVNQKNADHDDHKSINSSTNFIKIKRHTYNNQVSVTINTGIIKSIITPNNLYLSTPENVIFFNNKIFAFENEKMYEYNVDSGKQRKMSNDVGTDHPVSSVVISNNKIYIAKYEGQIFEFDTTNDRLNFVLDTKWVCHNGIQFNNKLYFTSLVGEMNEIDPQEKTERFISNFGLRGTPSKPIILNKNIYYFLSNGLYVCHYDIYTKEMFKFDNTTLDFQTNYEFQDPVAFKNWVYVIRTEMPRLFEIPPVYFPSTIYYFSSAYRVPSKHFEIAGKTIVSNFLIYDDNMFVVTRDGHIYQYAYGSSSLINKINITITGALMFDDKLYLSSNNRIYEYDFKRKESKVMIALSNKISFMKILNNRLYFCVEYSILYTTSKLYEFVPFQRMLKEYQVLIDWKTNFNVYLSKLERQNKTFALKSGDERKDWLDDQLERINEKLLVLNIAVQSIINQEKINEIENRIDFLEIDLINLENKVRDILTEIKNLQDGSTSAYILSSISYVSSLLPVVGTALSVIFGLMSLN